MKVQTEVAPISMGWSNSASSVLCVPRHPDAGAICDARPVRFKSIRLRSELCKPMRFGNQVPISSVSEKEIAMDLRLLFSKKARKEKREADSDEK